MVLNLTILRFYFTKILYWSLRLVVRTSGFHPGNRGSIPLGTTRKMPSQYWVFLFCLVSLTRVNINKININILLKIAK